PLFLVLIFGAFLSARKEKWLLAALLAALGTIVRPMGVFALLGIGLTLLWRRRFQDFAVACGVGLLVGVLYVLPLALYFGSPAANVQGYNHADWNNGMPLTFPLVAIVKDIYVSTATKLTLIR